MVLKHRNRQTRQVGDSGRLSQVLRPGAGLKTRISAGWLAGPGLSHPAPPLPAWPAGSCSSVVEETRQVPSLSSASSPPRMSAQNRDCGRGHPESMGLQFPTDRRAQCAVLGSRRRARAHEHRRRAVAGFGRVRLSAAARPALGASNAVGRASQTRPVFVPSKLCAPLLPSFF